MRQRTVSTVFPGESNQTVKTVRRTSRRPVTSMNRGVNETGRYARERVALPIAPGEKRLRTEPLATLGVFELGAYWGNASARLYADEPID